MGDEWKNRSLCKTTHECITQKIQGEREGEKERGRKEEREREMEIEMQTRGGTRRGRQVTVRERERAGKQ